MYINDNYAAEQGSLKNLVEANVGVKLAKNREIWLDAGILGSPYTNETPVSKEHLMYTRSLASEYTPYYLAGVKLGAELNKKWNAYLYVVNGWQQILNLNEGLSLGTQVEFRPNNNLLLNWDTYVGDESSASQPGYGMRYFTDLYLIYKPKGRFSLTSCVYAGSQQAEDSLGQDNSLSWWQANIIMDIQFKKRSSISARFEYFSDPSSVQVLPVTSLTGFETGSVSLGYKLKIPGNALFRLENRYFFSNRPVFYDPGGNPVSKSNLFIASLTAWF